MALDLTGIKIMLVEDDVSMRMMIKQLLLAFEVGQVNEYANATDALSDIIGTRPDIIISDWMMEPMDGLTFARQVRILKDRAVRKTPIIMLTGHTERRRVEQARDSGVNEYLAKPVSTNSMYARLQAVLERPRPFIDAKTYHGPDRRRKQIPLPDDRPDRRNAGAGKKSGEKPIFEISNED